MRNAILGNYLKPRPNDRNMSTQHCWAPPISFPEFRSPWPAVGNRELWNSGYPVHCAVSVCIFGMLWRMSVMVAPRVLVFRPLVKGNEALGTRLGRNILCAFSHSVAMCCDMLGVVVSSLKMVKFEPTSNMPKQEWPNIRNMFPPNNIAICCVDMLWSFGRGFTFCTDTCLCVRANDANIVRNRDAQYNTKETGVR